MARSKFSFFGRNNKDNQSVKEKDIEYYEENTNNNDDIVSDNDLDNTNNVDDIDGDSNNESSSASEDFSDSDSFGFEDTSDSDVTLSKDTFIDKLIDKIKNLSTRAIIFLVFLGIVIIAAFIIIIALISKNNKLYNATFDIPDIIYLGESDNIVVEATAKGNLVDIVTNFESSDNSVITMLNGSVQGPRVYDVLVPVKEGRATINMESFLDNKKLGSDKKEIVVCPKFDSSLIFSEELSVIKGISYPLNINFGEEECAKDVVYESSNNNIMTVSEEGEILGISEGEAYLIIKKGDKSFSTKVSVTSTNITLQRLNIDFSEIQLVKNEQYRITGSFSPSNATSQSLKFNDYDHDVIEVSDDGIITAIGEGSTDLLITSSDNYAEKTVKVEVYNPLSDEGIEPLSLTLNMSDLTINVGNTSRIYSIIKPSNTRDKRVSYSSSNNNVAMVTDTGVIYGKGPGSAVISVKASNGIERSIKVKVDSLAKPVVTSSDGIASDRWHSTEYTLNVSGSVRGSKYFYSENRNDVNNNASKIEITQDGQTIYYFKSCLGDVCSPTISYISKLDTTRPVVRRIDKSSNSSSGGTFYIHLEDTGSLVSKWCVVSSNDHTLCGWREIGSMARPIVTYVANRNGTYYAFAMDNVGNISEGKSFEVSELK